MSLTKPLSQNQKKKLKLKLKKLKEKLENEAMDTDQAPPSPIKYRQEQPPSPPAGMGDRLDEDTGSRIVSVESSAQVKEDFPQELTPDPIS